MIAALCCVSAQALWILTNENASTLVGAESWQDDQSADLSSGIAPAYEQLLKKAGVTSRHITHLFGVSGPGAFTGLRVSGAFLQGLARALGVELYGVSTFDLVGNSFYIPLQHQKARIMELDQMRALKLEFLKIESPTEFSVSFPQPGDKVMGLKDNPLWPSAEQLRAAIERQLPKASPFHLEYGTRPKIFGQR